jgi:hypothetical protein
MEGPEHRLQVCLLVSLDTYLLLSTTMQRRLIAPAFTLQSTKAMTPVFFRKAEELCDRWDSLIDESFMKLEIHPSSPQPAYAASEKFKNATIDIAHWLARASFDVVGLAGFGYHFKALECESEGVYLAFRRMLDIVDKGPQFRGILELFFPIIRNFWVSFYATRCRPQDLHPLSPF